MGIKDELNAYEKFLAKVSENIEKSIRPGSVDSFSTEQKANTAYQSFLTDYNALEGAWGEIWGFANDKPGSDNLEIKKKLTKFFQGTGNSKALAETIYDELVFKTDAVQRRFKKTYKTKTQLVTRFATITKLRKQVSASANKAIDLYNRSSVLGMAVFKARYYISGSLLNVSGMGSTDRQLTRKLDEAEAILRDNDVPDARKYQSRINAARKKHTACMEQCQQLGGAADVIQSSNEGISFKDNWDTIVSNLKTRYKVTLKKETNIVREADGHRVYRKCVLLQKSIPRISPELLPGSLTPPDLTPEMNEEERQRQEWLAAAGDFFMDGPVQTRALQGLKDYLNEDHLSDFIDLDSDGLVIPVFNSWVQPFTRAIDPVMDAIKVLDRAFQAKDLDGFEDGRMKLQGLIGDLDRAGSSSIQGFKTMATPFDDPALREEMQRNINSIAARIDNDFQVIIAELKAI